MTVRVTTLKGATAGDYYVTQLPNYYLDSGEPRGLWHGLAAEHLGVEGEIVDTDFLSMMAGFAPSGPDRALGRSYGTDSVRGFDLTASAPKSVSILFALGDPHTRSEVLAGHDAAVAAMIGWIEQHAHTRYRINGQVCIVDAEGIMAATFRQHTSRALDPQLHTHVVIPNKVRTADGRWLALDARLIKHDQQTVSAIYHAGLRAELTRRLGVTWNPPQRGIADIVGVPEVLLREFSARTATIEQRIAAKLDRFTHSMGREPSTKERWLLEREAAVDSRPAKTKAVNATALHEQWAAQAQVLGIDFREVLREVVREQHRELDLQPAVHGFGPEIDGRLMTAAVAALSEKQSSWRPAEIVRELAAGYPADSRYQATAIIAHLETLALAVEQELCIDVSKPVPHDSQLRRDGRPVTESTADRALTTRTILDQERQLIEWAHGRIPEQTVEPDTTAVVGRSVVVLNAGQAGVAAAVAGHDDLVLIVGPAGTGKTTALRPAVEQLRTEGRAVFGVAPSATAAHVLAVETGVRADTVDKLVIEHSLHRPPEPMYDLPAGATIIVDEAGMMNTSRLTQLARLADSKQWRVALVGDPQQFSAVGRGGMFALLVDNFHNTELEHVHRFTQTWEADASLRIRQGDPTVADTYQHQDRLVGGSRDNVQTAAIDHWYQERQQGRSVVLMAPSNDTVRRLNLHCQHERIINGEIDVFDRSILAGPYRIYLGDDIVTRHNDRTLTTSHDETVRNRAQWTITNIDNDGSIHAAGANGTIRLPADYVAEYVELAYASTAHGTQGQTVDAGILYLDGVTDVRNVYVAMTRGRDTNHAYITTSGEQTAADVFAQSINSDWIDTPAHERALEVGNPDINPQAVIRELDANKTIEQTIQPNIEPIVTPRSVGRSQGRDDFFEREIARFQQKHDQRQLDNDLSRQRHISHEYDVGIDL